MPDIDLPRRVDITERNVSDLARAHTELLQRVKELTDRIKELEELYRDRRIEDARREEREKSMQADINTIKGGLNKLLWIVGTAVIGGFATTIFWLIQGGLRVPIS